MAVIERTLPGWATTLVCLAAWTPTLARAEAPVPTGAWKGTVGQAAVMVCFAEAGESGYYYLRHKRGIHLWPSGEEGNDSQSAEAIAKAWRSGRFELDERVPTTGSDDKVSGHWQLEAKSPTEVTGTWTAPGGGKKAPISLRKVTGAAPQAPTYSGACEPAYYEPIRAAIQLKYQPAQFDGHAYREVSSEEATSMEVPASVPHAGEFNRHALEWLRDQSAIAYDCNTGRSDGGGGEPIGSSLKPVVWTPQFLVLQDSTPEIFCGGAHGSSSLSYATWSFERGRLVDTWDWVQGGQKSLVAHAGAQGRPITSGLFRLIARAHPRNAEGDDCKDVLDQMSVLAPYPTSQGLVFPTDFFHAMRACNDEVTISWKQVAPYLSAEGRLRADNWPRR